MGSDDDKQRLIRLLLAEYLSILENGEQTFHPQTGEPIIKRPSANMLGKINQFISGQGVRLSESEIDALSKLAQLAEKAKAIQQSGVTPEDNPAEDDE